MKIYCPKCSKVIDETEIMQYQGLCISCHESEQNLIKKSKIIKKEKAL